MQMSRCGCQGSRRSIWRVAITERLSNAARRCSTSSTAGIGICKRCRNSAWGRDLVCLCALGIFLSLGSPMIAQRIVYRLS